MTDLADFLERFVLPLVAGGEVHIGEPVEERRFLEWEVALGGEPILGAIDDARDALAAELVVRPPPLAFGSDELRLAVALYDALVLLHPRAEVWHERRGRRSLRRHAAQLARAPAAGSRRELVARHTLLARMCGLLRIDTKVTWWTGKAEFRGTTPPKRLTAWRTVRRVREEQHPRALADFVDDEARGVLDALLGASPLTDLVALATPARGFAPFRWGAQAVALRDPELARAVAYRWLDTTDLGGHPRALGIAAAAWDRALGAGLAPDDLRAITAFLVHLNALLAVSEAQGGASDGPTPIVGADDAATVLFLAIPDAAAAADRAFSPPGLAAEAKAQRRFAAHRAQARAAVGDGRIAELAAKLTVALGRAA